MQRPRRLSTSAAVVLQGILLDDVQAALANLAQFPEGSPLLRGRIRRKVLLRPPYTLMYSLRFSLYFFFCPRIIRRFLFGRRIGSLGPGSQKKGRGAPLMLRGQQKGAARDG